MRAPGCLQLMYTLLAVLEKINFRGGGGGVALADLLADHREGLNSPHYEDYLASTGKAVILPPISHTRTFLASINFLMAPISKKDLISM